MSTLARRNSSIHKVCEYNLSKINLEDEYEIVHVLQEGWRGRLLLVEHKATRNEVVLKAMHKDSTTRIDFFREFHYNYYLSPHRNILNAYDVAFMADNYYMFAQEFAPFGDLTTNMSDTGLGEINVKKIAVQLASALDFMHSKNLVHRDINMDNILIFKSDFSKIKLCDFGSTRRKGTLLKKKTVWLPYAPPEIVDAVQNEGYHADTQQDVWQYGVLIYLLLTGSLLWQKADLTDPHYVDYINWRKRRTLRTPKRFSNFTARLMRLFKRLLEPKPEKRCSVREVCKYVDDKWLVKIPKRQDDDVDNQSVCYSTYSLHSSKLEKDRVLLTLKAHGLETTVDRIEKKKRINEWLETSLSLRQFPEENTREGLESPINMKSNRVIRVGTSVSNSVAVVSEPVTQNTNSEPTVSTASQPSNSRKNSVVDVLKLESKESTHQSQDHSSASDTQQVHQQTLQDPQSQKLQHAQQQQVKQQLMQAYQQNHSKQAQMIHQQQQIIHQQQMFYQQQSQEQHQHPALSRSATDQIREKSRSVRAPSPPSANRYGSHKGNMPSSRTVYMGSPVFNKKSTFHMSPQLQPRNITNFQRTLPEERHSPPRKHHSPSKQHHSPSRGSHNYQSEPQNPPQGRKGSLQSQLYIQVQGRSRYVDNNNDAATTNEKVKSDATLLVSKHPSSSICTKGYSAS